MRYSLIPDCIWDLNNPGYIRSTQNLVNILFINNQLHFRNENPQRFPGIRKGIQGNSRIFYKIYQETRQLLSIRDCINLLVQCLVQMLRRSFAHFERKFIYLYKQREGAEKLLKLNQNPELIHKRNKNTISLYCKMKMITRILQVNSNLK